MICKWGIFRTFFQAVTKLEMACKSILFANPSLDPTLMERRWARAILDPSERERDPASFFWWAGGRISFKACFKDSLVHQIISGCWGRRGLCSYLYTIFFLLIFFLKNTFVSTSVVLYFILVLILIVCVFFFWFIGVLSDVCQFNFFDYLFFFSLSLSL